MADKSFLILGGARPGRSANRPPYRLPLDPDLNRAGADEQKPPRSRFQFAVNVHR